MSKPEYLSYLKNITPIFGAKNFNSFSAIEISSFYVCSSEDQSVEHFHARLMCSEMEQSSPCLEFQQVKGKKISAGFQHEFITLS